MQNTATIVPIKAELKKVSNKQAIVKHMLSPAEKSFIDLLAEIFVTKILKL